VRDGSTTSTVTFGEQASSKEVTMTEQSPTVD
jgi:hypothetical protein